MKFFISPPFGNYIETNKTQSIKGSFTLEPRDGLLQQIINTLYYSNYHNGWINKIGLRNPGIDYALKKYKNKATGYNNNIISIAILKKSDIDQFLKKIPNNTNLEINVSCPNAEKSMVDENIHKFLNPNRKWCIVKVSPIITNDKLDEYYKKGFRQFHLSNTLPVLTGGLSGKSLIPYNQKNISYLKNKYKDITIIGGGGITSNEDIVLYKKFGADHISISTLCFNPYQFLKFYFKI